MRRPWPTRANSKRHTIPRSASRRKPTCCEPGIPEAAPFRRLPKSYYIYLIRVVLRKWLRCDSVDSPHDESLPDSALPASSPSLTTSTSSALFCENGFAEQRG